jgi:hypothetical protein
MPVCIALSLLVACKTPATGDARPTPAAESPEPAEEPAPAAPPAQATRPAPRVVLVTIDGARWQDVFGGGDPALADERVLGAWADPIDLLPRLHGLAASGVAFGDDAEGCGIVRTHGSSNLSLPGYLELLGGRSTRCHWNGCERTDLPSILDDAERAGIPSASIASWEVLERAASDGTSGAFVAAGARAWSPPPAKGNLETMLASAARVGPFPGTVRTAYRPDSATRAIALEYLRSASPRLLHVGLGDTDEWAHRGNYVGYLRALHEADAFVGEIIDALQEKGARDATTILVTTDHGRGRDFREHGPSRPESGRVFLFAAGPRVAEPGTRCASRDIELPDVGATIRRLLDLPKDETARAGTPITEIAGRSDGT